MMHVEIKWLTTEKLHKWRKSLYFPFCVLLGDQLTACGELQHLLIKYSFFHFPCFFFCTAIFFSWFFAPFLQFTVFLFSFSPLSPVLSSVFLPFFYIAIFLLLSTVFSRVTLRCQGCRVPVFSIWNAQI